MDRPPLSPRDRRALGAIAAQFFVNGAMTASFIARSPQIRDRIGVTLDRFGLLVSIASLAGLAASLLAGRIVHRVSTKRVLLWGGAAMVSSLPLIGVATGPALWMAGLALYMFTDALVDISMNLQGSWISARRHTPVMNRLHGLWSLGFFAGGLGAVVANALGAPVPVHLTIVAAIMAVVVVAVTRNVLPADEDGHADAPVVAVAPPAGRARRLPITLLGLGGLFAVIIEVSGGDWSTFRLTDDFGSSAAIGSVAFVAYTIGMTAMRFGGDVLQLRLGHMGLHRITVALTMIGFVLALLVPSASVSIVGFVLVGIGVATMMPKLYDDAARLPGRRGAGLGAMTTGMRIGFLAAPVAIGAVAGTSWTVGAAVALFAIPATIGFAAVTETNARMIRRRAARSL